MHPDIERRMTRREASDYLNKRGYRVAVNTLAKYACIGGGPMFESWGAGRRGKPLYTETALSEWIASRTTGPRRSTSEEPKAA